MLLTVTKAQGGRQDPEREQTDAELLAERQPSMWGRAQYRLRRWYAGVFPPLIRTRERLWDELNIASEDLWPIQEKLTEIDNQTDKKVHPAFRRARWAIDQGDVETFWRNLYLIREWELRAIVVLEETDDGATTTNNVEIPTLEQKARSVIREARDRVGQEDLDIVKERLLDESRTGLKDDLDIDDVLAAIEVIYDHYRKEYSEGVVLRMLEIQVLTFIVATFTAVCLILAIITLAPNVLATNQTRPSFLLLVVWFGVLGAAVSGLFSLSDVLKGAEVPRSVGHFSLTLGRLVVGAAGALVLHIFLLSGILGHVFSVSAESSSSALAVAFIGGFSERLLRRAVEQAGGGTSASAEPEAATPERDTS